MTHDPDGKPFTAYIGYVSLHKDDAKGVIDVDFMHSRDAAKDRQTLAALLLDGYFTGADVETIRALWELGCTCGVITLEDGTRWDAAQSHVASVIERIQALLPPDDTPERWRAEIIPLPPPEEKDG